MNATMKKDGDFSLVKLGKLAAAVEAECGDLIARMKADVAAVQAGKEAKAAGEGAVSTAKSTLWDDFVTLAQTVDAFTFEAANENLTAAVFTAMVTEIAEGEAAKSIAAYSSTARKVISLVRSGAKGWAQVEEMAYEDVREALKSDEAKAISAASEQLAEQLKKVKKHPNKARVVAMLAEITELAADYAREAVNAAEAKKAKKKGAIDVPELQQQAPAEPATLETVKAA